MGEPTRISRTLDDSKAVELTGKIMVVAIIVFFVVVVFVIFLHLYAKWFWWRIEEDTTPSGQQSGGRRRRRRFVFAPGQDHNIATLRRGLEPSVLQSLPVLVFRPEDFKDGLECAVCLSELVHGEKARLLPKCNHGFHVDCIDMWFQSHSTCPLCRNSVAPESSSSEFSSSSMEDSVRTPVDDLASSVEYPNFPTNVLFWGNQTQVSSGNAPLEEGPSSQPSVSPSSSPSSAAAATTRQEGVLVIDIPSESSQMTSLSPSGSRAVVDDDLKSPVTTRLRSLKRLLSRDKRVSPCSPSSGDLEQGSRGQS
ncbi:43kDa postsynaptic protein [Trema orientale]|uniref:RING-type E3 ubiquitin transferase n=1 Tax=Trema orientale TaxID=63057 RepID=A0A2P5DY96_TREOI|nr:43kDa postsynaptic protein [Trema orientale]